MGDKSSSSSKGPNMAWWKIAGFTLGIVLIVAAISYTMVLRNSAASSGPLASGDVPSIGSNKSAADTMGIGEMTWVQTLTASFSKSDFVFVILPKGDGDSTKMVTSQVTGAIEKIQAQGISVSSMTLNPSDPELAITADRLAIKQLPAVLIIAKNGYGAIVTGNFDETKLLQTYVALSRQSLCPPGSSSGCCP